MPHPHPEPVVYRPAPLSARSALHLAQIAIWVVAAVVLFGVLGAAPHGSLGPFIRLVAVGMGVAIVGAVLRRRAAIRFDGRTLTRQGTTVSLDEAVLEMSYTQLLVRDPVAQVAIPARDRRARPLVRAVVAAADAWGRPVSDPDGNLAAVRAELGTSAGGGGARSLRRPLGRWAIAATAAWVLLPWPAAVADAGEDPVAAVTELLVRTDVLPYLAIAVVVYRAAGRGRRELVVDDLAFTAWRHHRGDRWRPARKDRERAVRLDQPFTLTQTTVLGLGQVTVADGTDRVSFVPAAYPEGAAVRDALLRHPNARPAAGSPIS